MSWVESAAAIGTGVTAVVLAVAAVRAKLTELTGKKDEPGLRDLVMRLDGKLDGMEESMRRSFLDLNKRVARVEVRSTWGLHADDITPEKQTRPGMGLYREYEREYARVPDHASDPPESELEQVRIRDSVTNED